MNRGDVGNGITHAAGAVLSATRALVAAAAAGDCDGVQQAIERRGNAVECLRRELDEAGATLSAPGRLALLESLALETQDATDELSLLRDRVAGDLRSMARGVRAVRGYGVRGPGSGDPSSLDRSG